MNIKNKYEKVFKAYFLWKELNELILQEYSRGVNIPEYITENLCCIINGYTLHAAEGGSEDAVDTEGNKIQIKATSNFDNDLSSFGPRSQFDILEFVRLDKDNDTFYFYRINLEDLNKVKVNHQESFQSKQSTGQRPRFSIIKQIIEPNKLSHYATVSMKTGDVKF